jgi:hypothetical protein
MTTASSIHAVFWQAVFRAALTCGALAGAALPQAQPAPTAPVPSAPPATAQYPLLSYPEDKARVVARIDGREFTLEQLVDHIEKRHCPHFRSLLTGPSGQLILRSDLLASWVRQFADVQLLSDEAAARKLDPAAAEPFLSAALKNNFEKFLAQYTDGLQRQGIASKPTQERINNLLTDYQMRRGLGCEAAGWLDFLEPDNYSTGQLRDYFTANPRLFGGMVTLQHILVYNRDPGTGILLGEEGQQRAQARIADIKGRLAPDGSNFADVAKLLSEDTATAKNGGELANVHRFDDRLPAILCRTAWSLKDGDVSGPVETQYGLHFVKRVSFDQKMYMIYHNDMLPVIREMMHRHLQENLLLMLRSKHKLELLL